MKEIKKKTWEEANYPIVRIPKSLYDDVKAYADKRNLSIGEALKKAWQISEKGRLEIPTFPTLERQLRKKIQDELEEEIRSQYESKIKALENENKELANMIRDASFQYEQLENEKKALENKNKELNGINAILKQRIDDLEKQLKEFEALDIDSLKEETDSWKDEANKLKLELLEERHRNDDITKELTFMKNEVCKELKKIGDSEPILKIQIDRLIQSINAKVDYEMQKF
jgi:chromosome segregation ATPase